MTPVADSGRSAATETERTAATADERVTSMETVRQNVDSLTEQARRLRTLLATFEVSESPSTNGARTEGTSALATRGDGGRPQ